VEETTCLEEVKQKLARKTYDLLLIAIDPAHPQTQKALEETRRLDHKIPLPFLPTPEPAKGDGPPQSQNVAQQLPVKALHAENTGRQDPGNARQPGGGRGERGPLNPAKLIGRFGAPYNCAVCGNPA